MELELFKKIEETLDLLKDRREEYQQIRKEIKYVLLDLLKDNRDMIMDISSRVKSGDSLREKIIRNRLYLDYSTSQDILDHLSDLIGLKIECRFISEENQILNCLYEVMNKKLENSDYFYSEKYPQIKLDLTTKQPQIQRNGFSIYRVDGYYERSDVKVNFELQIKSLVNSFWGDIEHKLVYKNTNYYVYDSFIKNLLSSINENLSIIDKQLHIIYDEMENSNRNQAGLTSEADFEKMIAKAINDVFTEKMKSSIGFTINIKNTSDILGHYIFIKNVRDTLGNMKGSDTFFNIFKTLNSERLNFKEEIVLEKEYVHSNPFKQTLGNYLISVININYDWYVFFKMLFALEPGNNFEDFSLFIDILLDYLVDNYWLKTSFMKLSMEEANVIQEKCLYLLAKALCEIDSIKIIYNNKTKLISNIFMQFVEELENRVISISDFDDYQDAYYHELKERLSQIF